MKDRYGSLALVVFLAAAAFVASVSSAKVLGFAADPETLRNLFLTLLIVATFKERAQEVFVKAWRGMERSALQRELDAASPEHWPNAQAALAKFKAATGQRVMFLSLSLGLLISVAGVRVLEPLVESPPEADTPEKWLFTSLDLVITAGLLAGGSVLIHDMMSALSTALTSTKEKLTAQATTNQVPVAGPDNSEPKQ